MQYSTRFEMIEMPKINKTTDTCDKSNDLISVRLFLQ